MRILDFLFRSTSSTTDAEARRHGRGGAQADATRGAGLRDEGPHTQPAPQTLQAERAERREMLYGVVRETMMRTGVLSASYKFKVLSLDVRGRQFLVMMDMAPDALHAGRFGEIENLMIQAAKARYDVGVTAVYWRANPRITANSPAPIPARAPVAVQAVAPMPVSAPMPASATSASRFSAPPFTVRPAARSAPMPLEIPIDERTTEPAALTVMDRRSSGHPLSRYEPIEVDEVVAFKKALASAGRGAATATGVLQRSGRRNPAPVGFEDTQTFDNAVREQQGLSATQYGELN